MVARAGLRNPFREIAGMRILVADDSQENLLLLSSILQEVGYEVVTAKDGAEAFEKLALDDFDVVISDVLMPVIDGFQLCRAIRKNERLHTIPIILYASTYSDTTKEDRALQIGADRFLKTPTDSDRLVQAIRQVVQEPGPHGQDSDKPATGNDSPSIQLYSKEQARCPEEKSHRIEQKVEGYERLQKERTLLFNLSLDMLCIAAFDGYFKELNPAWTRTLGWSKTELLEKPWLHFVHPEDKQATVEAGNSLAEGKCLVQFENRYRCKDGSYKWISWTSSPTPEMRRIFAVARDVTEEKQKQEELDESRRMLSTLMSNLPGMAYRCLYDKPRTMKFLSDGCLSLTGYPASDMLDNSGISFADMIHPKDRRMVRDTIRTEIANKGSFELEYRIRTSADEEKWVWEKGRAILGEEEQILFLEGFISDITERRRAEEALHEKEQADRKYQRQLTVLHEVVATLSTCESFDDLCRSAVELACTRLGFERLGIWFLEGNHPATAVGSFGIDEQGHIRDERNIRLSLSENDRIQEIASGGLSFIKFEDQSLLDHRGDPVGHGENVGVPIKSPEGTIGYIAADNLFSGNPFSSRQCELLALFGSAFGHLCVIRRAEDALTQTAGELRELFDNAPIAYHEIDTEGYILRVNRTELDMLGYSEAEMVGRPAWVFLSDREAARRQTLAKLSGAMPPSRGDERVYLGKDGSLLYVLLEDRILRDAEARITGLRTTMQDITERKQAEEEIESTAKFPEENPNPVLRINKDGVLIYVNWPAGVFLEAWECAVGDCVPEEIRRIVDEAILSNRPSEIEVDVGSISYAVTFAPISEAGYVNLYGRDVTEQKRATQALENSERMYRNAIEVGNAAVYYQNYITSEYEFVSDAIYSLIGYSPAEFTPALWKSITRDRNLLGDLAELSLENAIEKARSGEGVSWRADYLIETRDGEHRWIANSAVQVRDDEGTIVGSLGILQDITERKRLQEELLQSQKMEAVGRLAGGVAHDFNNLLLVINGYADFILQGLDPDHPYRTYVQEIFRAGERAASLTRQLLAFSRRQVLETKTLVLNEVVANMEKMLRRLIGEDIEFNTILDRNLGSIKADPGQIEQVIMNLAVNARDAMPNGGRLVIETSNVELDESYAQQRIEVEPGPYVVLAITDTGVGMDKETQARVFEPFFTTKEQGKGTGLGLATIYGIVKQSGGHIAVYSEPGQGTTFRVYLPRVGQYPLPDKKKNVESHLGGTESILVVEDEEAVRKLVCDVLSRSGYKIVSASNGEDALLLVEKHNGPLDLVLTDMVMPKMGGRDLVQRLTEIRPGIKSVYMSGYTTETVVSNGTLEAETNYLQKPFSPEDVLQIVRKALDTPAGES